MLGPNPASFKASGKIFADVIGNWIGAPEEDPFPS